MAVLRVSAGVAFTVPLPQWPGRPHTFRRAESEIGEQRVNLAAVFQNLRVRIVENRKREGLALGPCEARRRGLHLRARSRYSAMASMVPKLSIVRSA